jgi:hypothetical protein
LIILATICRQKSPKTCIYDLFIYLKIQEETECEYFEFEWIRKDHLALLGLYHVFTMIFLNKLNTYVFKFR